MDDGYRDELTAALERIAQLEAEVSQLRQPPPAERAAQLVSLREQRASLATGYEQGRRNVRRVSRGALLVGVIAGGWGLVAQGFLAGLAFLVVGALYSLLVRFDGGWGKRIAKLDEQIAVLENR